MAINLDEIVAGSNSVDELVSALKSESDAAQANVEKMAQVAQAASGSFNPAKWLKDKITAPSKAGEVVNDAGYKQYYIDQLDKGEEPLSKQEYLKQLEQERKNSKEKVKG